jgi:6-phosphofructokinase 2
MNSRNEPSPIITVTLNPCLDKHVAVDRVEPERKLRCDELGLHPGGGGLNVSRAIALLGGRSLAVWLSGGAAGTRLERLLAAAGLEQRPIRIAGETRENLLVHERHSGREYRFGMPGPLVSAAETHAVIGEIENTRIGRGYLVVSGSLPPGADPAIYAELASLAKKQSLQLVVDASGAGLQQAVAEGVHLLKPNLRELSELRQHTIRTEPEIAEHALRLVNDSRVDLVLVSLGAGGALLASAEGTLRLPSPTVPIRSRIGAGDSMLAGMVLALARGETPATAARFGVAAGAAAVMTGGTQLCTREDTERLFQQLQATA